MANIAAALQVVSNFLAAKGYAQQPKKPDVENGRWLYDRCLEMLQKDPCPSCVEVVLKEIFTRLEAGSHIYGEPLVEGDSDWTRNCTNEALRRGGFTPWPEAGETNDK